MTVAQIEYGLGVSEAERARLLVQCEIHRAEAESLIDRIGVGPGCRAIDIGCGPLGVLDILADRVGPTGAVVGLGSQGRTGLTSDPWSLPAACCAPRAVRAASRASGRTRPAAC